MKLSKTQARCVDWMIKCIDEARSISTPEEYCMKENNGKSIEWIEKHFPGTLKCYTKMWEDYKNGICFLYEKTETVKRLETLGVIEVLEWAQYDGGYEKVRLLNY